MTTRDQQVKQVIEGSALGTLAAGCDRITDTAFNVDSALALAFECWPQRRLFPLIPRWLPTNYLYRGLNKSSARKGVCAAWDVRAWLTPYVLYDTWSVDECLDFLAEHGTVTAAQWTDLGFRFISRLHPPT